MTTYILVKESFKGTSNCPINLLKGAINSQINLIYGENYDKL